MIRTFAAASAIAAILAAGPALAAATTLTAALSGANETAGGDPDGTGSFTVEIDADSYVDAPLARAFCRDEFDRLLSYVRPVCAAFLLPLALMEIRR